MSGGYFKKYRLEKLRLLPLSLFSRKKKRSDFSGVDNFIIYYSGALGDCVLSSHFVRDLKRHWPQAKITFLSAPGSVGFLKTLKEIDYLIPLRVSAVRRASRMLSLDFLRSFFGEARTIRGHTRGLRGDSVLICLSRMDSLLGAYKTFLMKLFVGASFTIGLDSNRGRGAFFDRAVEDPGNLVEHMTVTWKRILSGMKGGLASESGHRTRPPKIDFPRGLAGNLAAHGYCVIHTGGGSDPSQAMWTNKRWDIKKFYRLADWIFATYGLDVVFVGSKEEKDAGFDAIGNPHFHDLYGKTSLVDLMGLIQSAEFYVGNDSGIAHLASFLEVKSFVIWGYASHIDYGPVSPNTELIRLDLPCSPCLPFYQDRQCKGTDWETKCVRDISFPMVQDKIQARVGTRDRLADAT